MIIINLHLLSYRTVRNNTSCRYLYEQKSKPAANIIKDSLHTIRRSSLINQSINETFRLRYIKWIFTYKQWTRSKEKKLANLCSLLEFVDEKKKFQYKQCKKKRLEECLLMPMNQDEVLQQFTASDCGVAQMNEERKTEREKKRENSERMLLLCW